MKPLLFPLCVLLLLGCKNDEKLPFEAKPIDITRYVRNYETSVDWPGTYTGVLPCDGCVGIETFLTINKNLTYRLVQRKVAIDTDHPELETTGNFSWNEAGNVISMQGIENDQLRLKVGRLYLKPIDSLGFEVRPERGNNFHLLKH